MTRLKLIIIVFVQDKETLILLGNRRISVLFIGSGETKRKVPSLQTFIKDCVSVNYSGNGMCQKKLIVY